MVLTGSVIISVVAGKDVASVGSSMVVTGSVMTSLVGGTVIVGIMAVELPKGTDVVGMIGGDVAVPFVEPVLPLETPHCKAKQSVKSGWSVNPDAASPFGVKERI